jgi:hypothetical protein
MPWSVEPHIHLSRTLGTAPENAPDMKWKVKADGWLPVPTIIQEHRRTLTGKLIKHRLRDADGNVIKLMDFKYIVRCSEYWGMTIYERYDALLDMHGQEVYLVDSMHTADGLDHTAYVRPMYLNMIADVKNLTNFLDPLYITIELVDDRL